MTVLGLFGVQIQHVAPKKRGKKEGKKRKTGENPEKEKSEKELGLVVSQQTVIRNPASLSLLSRGKKRGNSEKEKTTKKN